MSASFTWLDYSEHERRRMLDVVDLFKEQDTRDELGIGAVRDAFADILFPGTGTVQTRARYFLFIPWIYLYLENRKVPSSEIARRARNDEVGLIDALAKAHPNAGEGVIGVEARSGLKRLPSNIYWLGLGTLGIRRFQGSQDQYHRYIDRYYRLAGGRRRVEGDGETTDEPVLNWHSAIPEPPAEFPEEVSFRLTRAESDYLCERIMSQVRKSLLAFLVDKDRGDAEVSFVWQHPQCGEFPAGIREELEHARNFSEIIHGAALLYNLMLAEKARRDELIERYKNALQQWAEMVEARMGALMAWDRKRFWQVVLKDGSRVSMLTQQFIERWLALAIAPSGAARIRSNNEAQDLIHQRERALKRGQARLDSQRALELWNGAAGTGQLDFRWRQAGRIVADILEAQKGSHA